ncbi:hypothetical protein A2U01_0059812, partial [Trifolium medium]|nr:hypothetical protein [Trifolium medium]
NGDLVKVNGTDDINESKHQQDLVEETREVKLFGGALWTTALC